MWSATVLSSEPPPGPPRSMLSIRREERIKLGLDRLRVAAPHPLHVAADFLQQAGDSAAEPAVSKRLLPDVKLGDAPGCSIRHRNRCAQLTPCELQPKQRALVEDREITAVAALVLGAHVVP